MHKLAGAIKRQATIWMISGLALVLFFISTEPLKLPLPLLLIPFILIATWVRSGVIAAAMLLRNLNQPTRKITVIASSLAAVVVLTMTLQSLGQLSWRDLLLIASLVGGLMFYFYKTDLL